MGCFVVTEFLLTSVSHGPSAIAELLVDTGAEISIRNTQFVQDLFPNFESSPRFSTVRNLGGGLVPVQRPIELTVGKGHRLPDASGKQATVGPLGSVGM